MIDLTLQFADEYRQQQQEIGELKSLLNQGGQVHQGPGVIVESLREQLDRANSKLAVALKAGADAEAEKNLCCEQLSNAGLLQNEQNQALKQMQEELARYRKDMEKFEVKFNDAAEKLGQLKRQNEELRKLADEAVAWESELKDAKGEILKLKAALNDCYRKRKS